MSYADHRRWDLKFSVGDHVFLKISPMKGVISFGKHWKLNPRYIRPFEILSRFGDVAYKLALPPELSTVHPVFQFSMLRKYIPDLSHILTPQTIQLDESLSYEEQPLAIVDRQMKKI